MYKKARKLIKNPILFFKDAVDNQKLKKELADIEIIYAFHINEWKRPIIEAWLPGKKIVYVPFNLKTKSQLDSWMKRIKGTPNCELLIWGMNLPDAFKDLKLKQTYVEDGFIRSIGLGASHTPPLSLNFDSKNLYFNSRESSDLEDILNTYSFDDAILERARNLRNRLVSSGISKYNNSSKINIDEVYGEKTKRRVLVIGQVEDDASIKYGSSKTYTNNDAVMIAHLENPDAQIIYKPHPDVINGFRKFNSDPENVRSICTIVTEDFPLSQSFETIDHVYTITSLAGFEALMRGIKVTTLGCPFYSGWGLTDDRQDNPRRKRILTLDEVFAACYIIYPQYFDMTYKRHISPEEALNILLSQKDIIEKNELAKLENKPKKTIFALHINESNRETIQNWFKDEDVVFVPFNFKDKASKDRWIRKIKNNPSCELLIWGMKAQPEFLSLDVKKTFIESGFISTSQLESPLTPSISYCFDSLAQHFNSESPSELENILQNETFDLEIINRAKSFRQSLIQLEDYIVNNEESEDITIADDEEKNKKILVIGQPENDSIYDLSSSIKYSNNELIMIAKMENPDADILYKYIDNENVGRNLNPRNLISKDLKDICTIIENTVSLSETLKEVDHVYTISSLAGLSALIRGIKVTVLGNPFYSGWGISDDRSINTRRNRKLTIDELVAGAYLVYSKYYDPLYKKKISPEDALKNLAFQKSIKPKKIEIANSENLPKTVFGFHINDWKRDIIKSWFPEYQFIFVPFNFKDKPSRDNWIRKIKSTPNSELMVWGMKIHPDFLKLDKKITYVEDGFIRSIGLGASHSAPLSLNFDTSSLYFNAREKTDLEELLQNHIFDEDIIQRARSFRENLISSGVSKYNNSNNININDIYGEKKSKRILVIGQVEDDASIEYGSEIKYTNNELVMIARRENLDAQIFYKPHPDVLNGFRKHQSNPEDVKNICDIIKNDIPLSQALESIDHVYTITSLAGFEALIRGIKVTTLGCPFYSGWGLTDDRQANSRRTRNLTVDEIFAGSYLLYPKYFDPTYKKYITPEEALDILKYQRDLNNSKIVIPAVSIERTIFGIHINDWKRPILQSWFPDHKFIYLPFQFKDKASRDSWVKKIKATPNSELFIWGMKSHPDFLKIDIKKTFIEDGFIRSVGLGASHTPPLSLNFDSRTLYFNAREESDLESILQNTNFDDELIDRAVNLKNKLISTGISKYNNSSKINISDIYGEKQSKRILVIGQVEDDASIEYGSKIKYTNNELVMIARMENPDAHIIYKPHPDVLSGFRKFQSDPQDVRNICQVILEDFPLSQAFETIDHVYTISSLAGFEALIRGITVTTMGCPFYSGWGLTDDRQENARRSRELTIDQLFAGAYILYPKYFNPLTRKYISPEDALDFLIEMKKLTAYEPDNDSLHLVEEICEVDDLISIREQIQSLEKSISLLSNKLDDHLFEGMKSSSYKA